MSEQTFTMGDVDRKTLRRLIEQQSISDQRIVTMSGGTGERWDYEGLAGDLLPILLKRLRERMPEMMRALAQEATAEPGLDLLSLAALADLLEEKGLPQSAGEIRHLAVQDGDLLVLQLKGHANPEQRMRIRESFEPTLECLRKSGRNVAFVVLGPEASLHRLGARSGP